MGVKFHEQLLCESESDRGMDQIFEVLYALFWNGLQYLKPIQIYIAFGDFRTQGLLKSIETRGRAKQKSL